MHLLELSNVSCDPDFLLAEKAKECVLRGVFIVLRDAWRCFELVDRKCFGFV
jgi:hypothetical protein